jgi:polysaccharide deacetylase family protein (PEP-CTERM system associated)
MTITNILSIDLEDWFHICGVEARLPASRWDSLASRIDANTRKILKVLKIHNITATFFALGYVADRHPRLIRAIVDDGHEIAVHGYLHQQVYRMTPAQFRQDLRNAIRAITALTGSGLKGFRAPEWSIRDDSLWALDILLEEGFAYDSSMAPLPIIGNPDYPRIPHRRKLASGHIWELPPLVASTRLGNLPIGGGWGLRVLPYRLIRNAIRALNTQGYPAVIFLHPREFDRANPRVSLPLEKRFVLEARIQRTPTRLARLLKDFRFSSFSHFLDRAQKDASVAAHKYV